MRTFTLTLSMPTSTPPTEPNGWQRFRKVLKALLRTHGLTCVHIQEQDAKPDEPIDGPLYVTTDAPTFLESDPFEKR